MRLRTVTILLLSLVPVFSLTVAYMARSTFWQASGEFFVQVPQYALAVFLIQIPPLLLSEFLMRRTRVKIRRNGSLIVWGVYETVLGIFLIRIFSLPEFWIASVGLTYLGFGTMVIGFIARL